MLDAKGPKLSFSVVDHLRWDLKQIFDMAIAEGLIKLNPASMLFTPKVAKRPVHSVLTIEQTAAVLQALQTRERMIAKLAIIAACAPAKSLD